MGYRTEMKALRNRYTREFEQLLKEGHTIERACDALDLSYLTGYRWPGFVDPPQSAIDQFYANSRL